MKSTARRSCEENSNEDDLLKKYYEVLERLDAVADKLRLEQVKVRNLEDEIDELQMEHELERLDFQETIDKQQEEIKQLTKAAKTKKRVSFEK